MHATRPDPRCAVLVVDDERGPRESLRLVLAAQFDVLTAESAEEALDVIRRQKVDVVTLDLKMPGVSGAQALAEIRTIDPDVEVVIVTGYGSFECVVEILKLHAFDYVTKPFDPGELLTTVREAAESRRRRREARRAEQWLGSLQQIVDEVEHWCEESGPRLPDPDRDALAQILGRLQSLRARRDDPARGEGQ
jgi:DNA-binding NtrC family response regulator